MKEREILVHRQGRDKRICDRIKAMLLWDDGYCYSEIGRMLILDDKNIRHYIEAYLKHQNAYFRKWEEAKGNSINSI